VAEHLALGGAEEFFEAGEGFAEVRRFSGDPADFEELHDARGVSVSVDLREDGDEDGT
jgi:hypothetical protein